MEAVDAVIGEQVLCRIALDKRDPKAYPGLKAYLDGFLNVQSTGLPAMRRVAPVCRQLTDSKRPLDSWEP